VAETFASRAGAIAVNERTERSSAPHGHQDGVQHELVMNRASAAQRRAPHAARADLTSRISRATRHLLQVSPASLKTPEDPWRAMDAVTRQERRANQTKEPRIDLDLSEILHVSYGIGLGSSVTANRFYRD